MEHNLVTQLVAIVTIGITAQLCASLLRIPSILLLLLSGLLVGPVLQLINPDQVFGHLLSPFTSLAVALILFEGGLGLKLSELREAGPAIRNVITAGSMTGWALTTAAAYYLLNFQFGLALLLGALLIVTGPTVTIPLLQFVRPSKEVSSVLKWEAILTDPVGAVLAVVIFEALTSGAHVSQLPWLAFNSILLMVAAGTFFGVVFAAIVIIFVRASWVPEQLEISLTVVLVLVAYCLSNSVQGESGLLAVTVMGIVLTNQKSVPIRHIFEFKESLKVLLLSCLFIILAARIDLLHLVTLLPAGLAFVATLVVIRCITVLTVTTGTSLSRQSRLFIAGVAPRGIVAAAVSGLLGQKLVAQEYPGADIFAPIVFIIIIGTVIFYSLAIYPLKKLLDTQGDAQRVLLLGSHDWAVELALNLKELGLDPLLVDSNEVNARIAHKKGLTCLNESILNDECREALSITPLRYFLALTSNDAVNTLGILALSEDHREGKGYKLPAIDEEHQFQSPTSSYVRTQLLFDKNLTFDGIEENYLQGKRFQIKEGEYLSLEKGEQFILVGISEKGELMIATTERPLDSRSIVKGIVFA